MAASAMMTVLLVVMSLHYSLVTATTVPVVSIEHKSTQNVIPQTRRKEEQPFGSPPPGSPGVKDFRYPDWVVQPEISCKEPGYFAHPRNCSWFYRCQDPYSLGYFRKHYFQCSPGTFFSDAMDQCVMGSEAESCRTDQLIPSDCLIDYRGSCVSTQVCPTQSTNFLWSSTNIVCTGTTMYCPSLNQRKPVCQPNHVFDITAWRCLPENQLCSARTQSSPPSDIGLVIKCQDYAEDCLEYSQCSSYYSLYSEGFRSKLCKHRRVCEWRGNTYKFDVCNGYLDIKTHKCIEKTLEELCPYRRQLKMQCYPAGYQCQLSVSCETGAPVYLCSPFQTCGLVFVARAELGCMEGGWYNSQSGLCHRNVTAPLTAGRQTTLRRSCVVTNVESTSVSPTTTTTTEAPAPEFGNCAETDVGKVMQMSAADKARHCELKHKCALNGDYLYSHHFCRKHYICERRGRRNVIKLTTCSGKGSELLLEYNKCDQPHDSSICNPKLLPTKFI